MLNLGREEVERLLPMGEITLFESLGLAVEDLAAARHVWRKARET